MGVNKLLAALVDDLGDVPDGLSSGKDAPRLEQGQGNLTLCYMRLLMGKVNNNWSLGVGIGHAPKV